MKIWAASSSLVELLWGSHMGSCCETSQISVIHPVTWKVSSNEQPEREGSSVAANRHCCHLAVPLAHQGYQLCAGRRTMEALPSGPMQGMGAAGVPVLSPLDEEGGPSLPTALRRVGDAPGLHRGPPTMVQRTKFLAAGCQSLAGMGRVHPERRACEIGNGSMPGCCNLDGIPLPPSLPFFLPWLSLSRPEFIFWTVHLGVTLGLAALAMRTLLLISSSDSSMASSNPSFLFQCCAPSWQCCALLCAHPHMCSERESLCPPSHGVLHGGQLDACRGPEPGSLPQLLVLCPCPVSPGCALMPALAV